MQGYIRASIIGVYLGGSSSNPQGTRITSILMELVFLPYSSNMQYIKRGKGEKKKKKPYFVLLAIYCKETLKHFLGFSKARLENVLSFYRKLGTVCNCGKPTAPL